MFTNLVGYLMSPLPLIVFTLSMASTTIWLKNFISEPMILEDMEVMAQLARASGPNCSTFLMRWSLMNLTLYLAAILKPLMI